MDQSRKARLRIVEGMDQGTGDRGRGTISISHIEMTFKTRPAIVCPCFGTKAVVVSPCEGIVTNLTNFGVCVCVCLILYVLRLLTFSLTN